MPTTSELEEARMRWERLAASDRALEAIADFHERRLEAIAARPAPEVALRMDAAGAKRAIREGQPLLVAGEFEVDLAEVEEELRATAGLVRSSATGQAAGVAAAIASTPASLADLVASALRGDGARLEAAAFALNLPAAELAPMCELAVQPALWRAAEEALLLTDFFGWQRGYCPVCGAWPLYAELVGAQRERHLRCGRCGSRWGWAILLCPYCGNDDHRSLGVLENPEEREHLRVDTCERCKGYLKSIAAFTPVGAAQLAAEDTATVHLDVAARERGYARPGRPPDPAVVGVPRAVREPPPPHDQVEG